MSSEREKRWRYRLGLAAEALGLDRILDHELRPEGQLQRPKSYGDSTLGPRMVGLSVQNCELFAGWSRYEFRRTAWTSARSKRECWLKRKWSSIPVNPRPAVDSSRDMLYRQGAFTVCTNFDSYRFALPICVLGSDFHLVFGVGP